MSRCPMQPDVWIAGDRRNISTKESVKNKISNSINKAAKLLGLWKVQKAICLAQLCVEHSYMHTLQAGDGSDSMVAPPVANTIYVAHS